MATGITKKNWNDETTIITDEIFNNSYSYEISYKGKTKPKELLKSQPEQEYQKINSSDSENLIFNGDNIDVLKYLIHKKKLSSKVKLVYIDPPYGTNSIFHSRNQKSSYRDDLIGSHYIEFLRRRLILIKELLSDDGSIYVHLDSNMTFEIKLIMDEIFGPKNFRGFISRKKCSNKNSTKNSYGNISDYILYYSKSKEFLWNRALVPWTEEKIKKEYSNIDEATGRRYKKVPIHAPGIRNGETGKPWRGKLPPEGKHWQYTPSKLDILDKKGEIYWSANGNPRRKVFFDENKGVPVQDIWLDVADSINQNMKVTGYPTEKNPKLIERIVQASTNKGDLVLDCFAGSGTTLEVANKLDRKWIGVDNSSEAIESILTRFTHGTKRMGDYVNKSMEKELELNLYTLTNFEFHSDKRFVDINKTIYDKINLERT